MSTSRKLVAVHVLISKRGVDNPLFVWSTDPHLLYSGWLFYAPNYPWMSIASDSEIILYCLDMHQGTFDSRKGKLFVSVRREYADVVS